MDRKEPFCVALEEGMIVVIFNDELATLQEYAMDSGDALWYILGTDAWLEDINEWIEDRLENKGMDINGLVLCYYSEEARKKYHGSNYTD